MKNHILNKIIYSLGNVKTPTKMLSAFFLFFVLVNNVSAQYTGEYANVAYGKAASASDFSSGYPPSEATNGTGGTWCALVNSPAWLMIDLGNTYYIDGYGFDCGNSSELPNNFTFQGSTDASNWTNIDSRSISSQGSYGFNCVAGNYRYVRFDVTFVNTYASFSEVYIYGTLGACINPTSGGTIAGAQTICSGFVPAVFSSTTDPSGYTGTLEYKWQVSTTSSSTGFSDIASSNSATFTPSILTTTSWYKRLSKVTCIADEWATASVPLSNLYIFSEGAGGSPGNYNLYDGGGGAGGVVVTYNNATVNPGTIAGWGGDANGGQGGQGGSGFGAGGGGGGFWYGMGPLGGGQGANGFAYFFNDNEEFFTQINTTYTVQHGGDLSIILMGGGGGGGGGVTITSNSGGGAGYLSKSIINVQANSTITITIGAGGQNSTNGGTTSVTVNGQTYTALGGYHGATSQYGGNGSSAGGVGYPASGAGFSGGASDPSATGQGTAYFSELMKFNLWSDALTIIVNQPSFTPANFTVANLQATGENIKWYSDATGGTALANSTELENGHHYYASQTVNGIESTARFDVVATFDLTPCAPTGNATQSFSAGATVSDLVANGTNISWYSTSSGGTALNTGTPLVNGAQYFATQTVGCTESATRLDVVVVVN